MDANVRSRVPPDSNRLISLVDCCVVFGSCVMITVAVTFLLNALIAAIYLVSVTVHISMAYVIQIKRT